MPNFTSILLKLAPFAIFALFLLSVLSLTNYLDKKSNEKERNKNQ